MISNELNHFNIRSVAADLQMKLPSPNNKSFHIAPSDYDVVCGRGKGSYNKPGNKRFRAIVTSHVKMYQESKTKLAKSFVLETIIQRVRQQNGGNCYFLKYNYEHNDWCEMNPDEIKEKVGHAIREAIMVKQCVPLKEAKKSQLMCKQAHLLSIQKRIFSELLLRQSS